MRRKRLILAAVVVMAANAVALIEAGRNRSRRIQTIELTERELPLGYHSEDNSGLDVRLTLASEGAVAGLELDWLDARKLRELGFDTGRAAVENYWQLPPRQAYVALEYDGPAWRRYLDEARKNSHDMDSRENTSSHLVAVDAARTPEILLAKYGSTGRHLIVRAKIAAAISAVRKEGSARTGWIADIMARDIHVPLPVASGLERFVRRGNPGQGPRYTMRLAYGVYYEPWVESAAETPR